MAKFAHLLVIILGLFVSFSNSYSPSLGVSDVLLREMVARMGNGLADNGKDYLDLPQERYDVAYAEGIPSPLMLSNRAEDSGRFPSLADYDQMALSPSLRDQEYLSHSSLLSSVMANYGSEGKQRLKPASGNGGVSATTEMKSEAVLPAYCNPPNPCPVGYNADDGCLEEFENTAGFSREFQSGQDCMCDSEHMFQCQDNREAAAISAIARSMQGQSGMHSTLDNIIDDMDGRNHRLVAKKFHQKKSINPYLQGDKLPTAAKKGERLPIVE